MTKISITLFGYLLLFSVNIFAQKSDFGETNDVEINLKYCLHQEEANATVLFDVEEVNADLNMNIIVDRHQRIKIFKDKELANKTFSIVIESENDLQKLIRIKAHTINFNIINEKDIIVLDSSKITSKKIDATHTQISFEYPNVKAGSILEVEYKLLLKPTQNIPVWYFQSAQMPVNYSAFSTSVPALIKYKTSISKSNLVTIDSSAIEMASEAKFENELVQKTYIKKMRYFAGNLNELNIEKYTPAKNIDLCRIELVRQQSYHGPKTIVHWQTWRNVAKALNTDGAGAQLQKFIGKKIGKQLVEGKKSEMEKIAIIFDFIKNDFTEEGLKNIKSNCGIDSVLLTRKANNAGLNILLVALLHSTGLKAMPVFISSANLIKNDLPNGEIFDDIYVLVKVDGKNIILDATDKKQSIQNVPTQLIGHQAYVLTDDLEGFEIITIDNNNHPFERKCFVLENIDAIGNVTGKCNFDINYYEMSVFLKNNENNSKEALKRKYKSSPNKIDLTNQVITPTETIKPNVKEQVKYNYKINLDTNTQLNFLDEFDTNNPFSYEKVNGSFDLLAPIKYFYHYTILLDDALTFTKIPSNKFTYMGLDDALFDLETQQTGNALQIKISMNVNKTVHSQTEYSQLKEFYTNALADIKSGITISKK